MRMLLRVSPSGKAQASQACIRGFESRHPLHKKHEVRAQKPDLLLFDRAFFAQIVVQIWGKL